MAGIHAEILYGADVDFRSVWPPAGQMGVADGNLLIGSTVAPFIRAALPTSSDGSIAFTFGNGTIDMSAASPSGGFTWTDVSGAFSPTEGNGYFITGTSTGTLPASPSQGDTIQFFVDHASQFLTIQAAGTQTIRMGSLISSATGTAVSTSQGDSCELVYRSSNDSWQCVDMIGTWVLA